MKINLEYLLKRFLLWRVKNVSEERFIVWLSIFTGLFSGVVAVVLKNTTHAIQHFVTSERLQDYYQVYYFLFPIIGITITVIIARIIAKPIGEGIPSTLYAISRRNGILKPYKMYASVITSAFTVGFGGSVGLEGPSVSTGSAIGSNLGRIFRLSYKQRILLISCATAGAIASIFGAPIAAIVFTIEIFALDLTMSSLVPLLLASVSGSVMSMFLTGGSRIFRLTVTEDFVLERIPAYLGLAIICAFASIYFKRMFFTSERIFEKIKSPYAKVAIGGTLLGMFIFLIPPLYGEGYVTINNLLNGNEIAIISDSFLFEHMNSPWTIVLLVAGLFFFKVFASSFTLHSGGVGGIFAPTLFMGSALGFAYARVINLLGIQSLPESNFALVAMTGLMAGILHSPLTAIFLIAEVTGGYDLFLPLMLTSATSYFITKSIDPHSIYTEQLARRGDLITHNKDRAILTLMRTDQVIETDFIVVESSMYLRELVEVFTRSKRNIYPVTHLNKLVGVLTLDDFKAMLFDRALYDKVQVKDLMLAPPAVIDKNESMELVMKKFQETNAWNLPVTDENGHYIGFISKSKLFNAYRKKLIEVSGEG